MAWISEIVYKGSTVSNHAGISTEGVEVSLTAAEFARRGDIRVCFYQHDGTHVGNRACSDYTFTLDPNNGHYVGYLPGYYTGITEPDDIAAGGAASEAVALTDRSTSPDTVIEFYDIGSGTTNIQAIGGPAAGAISVNTPGTTGDNAIQFGKNGQRIETVVYDGYTHNRTFLCFCEGTLIETEAGLRPIEELKAGDQIRNDADDLVPLRWLGSHRFDAIALAQNPKLRPVRISAGALGNGLPKRDLLVSRQHRILVSSAIAARVAEAEEVLIPAIKLTELPGIYVDQEVEEVTYFHLLFDRHEVIWSEGALTESLYPGSEALKAVSPEAERELRTLFPELEEMALTFARPVPNPTMQREIVARHAKQARALQNQARAA